MDLFRWVITNLKVVFDVMRKSVITVLFSALYFLAIGQEAPLINKPFIEWRVAENSSSKQDTLVLDFTVFIDTNWELYAINDNVDSLDLNISTQFICKSDNYKFVGLTEAINPKKRFDSTFERDIRYFDKIGVFRKKIVLQKESTAKELEISIGYSMIGKNNTDDDGQIFIGSETIYKKID